MTSCLFVHDCEHDDISNFIKLIAIQILNTMNPFAFEINYWDTKELGMDMMVFDPLSTANLFNIKTDEKDIKDSITDLMAILKKRSVNILREYANITQYNKAMRDLDSVTESYNLIFIPNFSKDVYNSGDMKSLIYKGSKVGIYPVSYTHLDVYKRQGPRWGTTRSAIAGAPRRPRTRTGRSCATCSAATPWPTPL